MTTATQTSQPAGACDPSSENSTRPPAKAERVSNDKLIQVTEAADTAFGGFDFSAHEGKGVRVFIQGFG